jgi:spore photoproduct lyase
VKYFAGTDRYFLIHSKSANVDHLLDLDHKGHTIVLWSLTSETVTRDLEKDSAPTRDIIEAARKCQDAGYPVRFKFKPVVPVVGWRQECADMIRQVFERTRPDMLSMCTMWCHLADLKIIIPPDLLDPECLRACEEGAEEMKNLTQRPFPHNTRAEIYSFLLDEIRKWDKDIPVSISTETQEMWRDFGPKLGFGMNRYVCGCGPQAVPNVKRLKANPFTIAKLRSI